MRFIVSFENLEVRKQNQWGVQMMTTTLPGAYPAVTIDPAGPVAS